jgi:hypothetical protein
MENNRTPKVAARKRPYGKTGPFDCEAIAESFPAVLEFERDGMGLAPKE